MGQLDLHGFYPDNSPNQSLFKIADTLNENTKYREQKNYQREKDAEGEQWKKMSLIQDLTDLSKHQTSSDVANAVANQKASEILQKYTAAAKKLSYADLQGGIAKDMSGVMGGLDAMKTELDQSEAATKILKQKYPSLNVEELVKAQREDVLHRRMDGSGNFINPMTVAPPTIDVTDPNTLSKYLGDTKALDDTIVKAAGADPVEVATGDPYTNVTYGGKIPFWSTPNFVPDDVKGGFLKKGFVPQLSIKSEDLPADFMPALKNNPRKIVTSDVHDQFMAQHPLEVMKGTRDMFPTYDKMNDGEKHLAESDYLYTKLKGLDQSNFQYKSSKSPAITHNRTTNIVNTGGANTNINDIYQRIEDAAKEAKNSGGVLPAANVGTMPTDQSNLIVDLVNKSYPDLKDDNGKSTSYNADDLYIFYGNDGKLNIRDNKGKNLGILPKTASNLKVQPGVKEKRTVISQGDNVTPSGKKKYKGLDKHGNPIFE